MKRETINARLVAVARDTLEPDVQAYQQASNVGKNIGQALKAGMKPSSGGSGGSGGSGTSGGKCPSGSSGPNQGQTIQQMNDAAMRAINGTAI
jgi:hypothetical protein